MSLVLQSSGGGQITIQEPATASNFTATLPATTGTLVVTGTTPTLNGITFPATQVPSADANTLDDYEEGTWTPSLAGSVSDPTGVTYDGRAGFYTKVGRLVTVNCSLGFTTYTGGSGAFRISGLPFATSSTASSESASGILTERFVVASASYTYFTIRTNSNVSFLELMQSGSNVAWQGVPYGTGVTSSATGKYLTAVLTYMV
jgi:hypothetical protein